MRQKHHANGGQTRPQQSAGGLPLHHGDSEWTEELQGARRTQRNSADSCHEQEGDSGGDHAKQHACHERGPGEGRGPRPHDDEQDQTCPRQPEPRRASSSDLVDQADRQRQTHLHAQHRDSCHHGAAAGRSRSHYCIECHDNRSRPHVMRGPNVQEFRAVTTSSHAVIGRSGVVELDLRSRVADGRHQAGAEGTDAVIQRGRAGADTVGRPMRIGLHGDPLVHR